MKISFFENLVKNMAIVAKINLEKTAKYGII